MPFPATPALTTDCVVFDGSGRVLLIRRKYPPFQGRYALPGGFVEIGETVEDACRRELKEETGVEAGALRLIGVYSDPERDPRGHTCSVAFLTRVGDAAAKAGDDAAAGGVGRGLAQPHARLRSRADPRAMRSGSRRTRLWAPLSARRRRRTPARRHRGTWSARGCR